MDLTDSWSTVIPADLRARYEFRETRNAAAILAATSSGEFDELCAVLRGFTLEVADLVRPGGNESELAHRLNDAFRELGWREGRVDTVVRSVLHLQPHREAGEQEVRKLEREVVSEGYKVDNVKGRVALDVEWNAKDGNLDRDIGAYRSLYDVGLIDGAVLVTRTKDDLRAVAYELAVAEGQTDKQARSHLATSTTTNLVKLLPRMTRGDAGGCPVLAAAICPRSLRGGGPRIRALSSPGPTVRADPEQLSLDPPP